MSLLLRAFYTVHELAARMGYTIADIAGWSAAGDFDIVTGIPPVTCGDRMVAGEVIISAFDILPMFRRCGTGPVHGHIHRVRPKGEVSWQFISDPVEGVDVYVADLLVSGLQARRFEEKHGLLCRVKGGTGSSSPYDWEGMLQALVLHIHDSGVPKTQAELVAWVQEWFVMNAKGQDIPDERSIRRRITPILRALKKSHGLV